MEHMGAICGHAAARAAAGGSCQWLPVVGWLCHQAHLSMRHSRYCCDSWRQASASLRCVLRHSRYCRASCICTHCCQRGAACGAAAPGGWRAPTCLHSPKWSSGKMPFSGGLAPAPRGPPNALIAAGTAACCKQRNVDLANGWGVPSVTSQYEAQYPGVCKHAAIRCIARAWVIK
jgi:hypothetical protein